jgi:hypothetical protein
MTEYFLSNLAAQWKVENGDLRNVDFRNIDGDGRTHATVIFNLEFSRGSFGWRVPLVKVNGEWRVTPP